MASQSSEATPRRHTGWVLGLLVLFLVASAAPARAEEQYNPREAGNLVRIAAYIMHPAGVLIDYAIMRPAWWIGSREPFRTIFGHHD